MNRSPRVTTGLAAFLGLTAFSSHASAAEAIKGVSRSASAPYYYVQTNGSRTGDTAFRNRRLQAIAKKTGVAVISVARTSHGVAVYAGLPGRTHGEAVANAPYAFSHGRDIAATLRRSPRLLKSLASMDTPESGLDFRFDQMHSGMEFSVSEARFSPSGPFTSPVHLEPAYK